MARSLRSSNHSVPEEPAVRFALKISVIIATYRSGSGIDRVIASLDNQTMPQNEFEVIVVDDGSPDGTLEHLLELARSRPNVRVLQIEHSGWPSRPRNVGIGRAQGEYITFMDHDDSLFPDGLRAAYRYAIDTGADFVSPKESKTNDPFWQMNLPLSSNAPNVKHEHGLAQIFPLVPHKLYANRLLNDHHIRFPEGGRVLWEDQFINIEAFRHAHVVAAESQTPFYLWHRGETNTSGTFGPDGQEFWDRLVDIIEFAGSTLAGAEFAESRAFFMLDQIRRRIIGRTISLIGQSTEPGAMLAMKKSRELLGRYLTDELRRQLRRKHQIQAMLIEVGDVGLVRQFHEYCRAMRASADAKDVTWERSRLLTAVDARLGSEGSGFGRAGDRVIMNVPAEVQRRIPPEFLDVTNCLEEMSVRMIVRSRGGSYISWHVPADRIAATFETEDSGATPVWRGTASLDIDSGSAGRELSMNVYDFRLAIDFAGLVRKPAVGYAGILRPALINGRAATAFSSKSSRLALDLAQHIRTLPIDAWPTRGPAGHKDHISARLEQVHVYGGQRLPVRNVIALAHNDIGRGIAVTVAHRQQMDTGSGLQVAVTPREATAYLEGSVNLPAGLYDLYTRRSGRLHRTSRQLLVETSGAVTIN